MRTLFALTLVFSHVNLIDTDAGKSHPDMTVVVRGGRIADVGRTTAVKIPQDAQRIDATGKYLIPGLWDMHAHRVPDTIPLFLANGITCLRSMNDNLDAIRKTRDRVASGDLLGPRIYFCGPFVDGPQRPRREAISVSTPEEGRAAVVHLKQEGVDFIKVYEGLSRGAYFAIADEAKKQHIPFAGHVPPTITAAEASDAGQKSIEHLKRVLPGCAREEARSGPALIAAYDPEKAGALFRKFVANGTWQTPTFTVLRVHSYWTAPETRERARSEYVPAAVRDSWPNSPFTQLMNTIPAAAVEAQRQVFDFELEVVGRMHRAGVQILAGTDCSIPYIIQGFSLHHELEWLVKAGLSPMEALRSATLRPAQYFGIADSAGSIAKGKFADLVLLSANPLRDISNTQKIESVVVAGRYLNRAELDKMLDSMKGR